jgi:hypothetical protein
VKRGCEVHTLADEACEEAGVAEAMFTPLFTAMFTRTIRRIVKQRWRPNITAVPRYGTNSPRPSLSWRR